MQSSSSFHQGITDRLLLLGAVEESREKWTFQVADANSHAPPNTLCFTSTEISCSCGGTTSSFCKHMSFLRYKVITSNVEDASSWNPVIFKSTKSAWRARFKRIVETGQISTPTEQEENSSSAATSSFTPLTCCVCFEDIQSAQDCATCPQGCKRSEFHSSCITAWLQHNQSCPLCRTRWTRKRSNAIASEDDDCLEDEQSTNASELALQHVTLLPDSEAEEGEQEDYFVDIVISFDETGSMCPCVNEVKRKAAQLIKDLVTEMPRLRIAIIAHTDFNNHSTQASIDKCVQVFDFSNDVDALVSFIQNHRVSDENYDYQECYEYVLQKVHSSLSWRAPQPKYIKALVMIGDAVPHEVSDPCNKFKIDWKLEADKLKNRDISVFSVQCLYSGSRETYHFWNELATLTNGYHMFLDQFANIQTMIRAICFRQHEQSAERLAQLESDCLKGGMSQQLKMMFDTLTGKRSREDVYAEMHPDAYTQRYRSSYSFSAPRRVVSSATSSAHVIDETAAAAHLLPCAPSKFQIFEVDTNCSIKEFCTKMGIEFAPGRGFYEFSKTETISEKKEVVAMEKSTGNLFEGDGARELIGLPTGTSGKIKPSKLDNYVIFVQSTSYTRKLEGGKRFLYDSTSSSTR